MSPNKSSRTFRTLDDEYLTDVSPIHTGGGLSQQLLAEVWVSLGALRATLQSYSLTHGRHKKCPTSGLYLPDIIFPKIMPDASFRGRIVPGSRRQVDILSKGATSKNFRLATYRSVSNWHWTIVSTYSFFVCLPAFAYVRMCRGGYFLLPNRE